MRWEAKISDRIASLESVLIHLNGTVTQGVFVYQKLCV